MPSICKANQWVTRLAGGCQKSGEGMVHVLEFICKIKFWKGKRVSKRDSLELKCPHYTEIYSINL